jgi:hypothetical protein
MTNPIYTLPYQETPLDRDTRDRVVRIESFVERLTKDFESFVKESRESRKEILEMIEEINTKHKEYDAMINKEKGKWMLVLPFSAIIGSILGWCLEYFIHADKLTRP